MKSIRLSAFQRLKTANLLQSDRWTVQILLFCASLGFSSVLLEQINLRIGFYWFWILAVLSWKLSSRWARRFVEAGERDELVDTPSALVSAEKKEDVYEWLSFSVSFFIWCLVIYHLLFYFYELNGNWVIRNGNLNGDWPYHMNMIQYLVKLDHFWPENPVFFGDHMRYSFGINWLTALFVRGGVPLTLVVALSSMILVTVLMIELYKWFGVCGILAFFLSGGGWGVPIMEQLQLWGPGSTLAWKNLFLAVFVPQRGMWFALPCGVFLIRYLFQHLKTPEGLPRRQKKTWGFLWAMLPFFHLHTFFLVSVLVGGLWLFRALPPLMFYLVRRAWIPLFFIFHSVGSNNLRSSVKIVPNWMSTTDPAWQSWVINFGPWLLLPLILAVFHQRIFAKVPHLKAPFFLTLAMFGLFSHLMLAPWAWDQIKIILWLYLILTALVVLVLESQMLRLGVAFLLAAVLAPGISQFSGGHPAGLRPSTLWSTQDRDAIALLLSEVPPSERLITAPDPHHPVFAIGQPIVAGYAGHLWSHGLDVTMLEESIKQFVLGQEVAPRWRTLTARYLLFGRQEKQWLGVEELPADSKWVKIKSVGDRSLYYRSSESSMPTTW